METKDNKALELFHKLAALPPEERVSLLDREASTDPDLRRRVEVMLEVRFRPAVALLPALRAGALTGSTDEEKPSSAEVGQAGQLIDGRYQLLERIGRGGMGEVWRAQQVEPVRRAVALKLIRPGMDSLRVLRMFEAERQTLAIMGHPNIAAVFDGGAVDQQVPYFVMELVDGEAITAFCDRHRLPVHTRLELLVQVCGAVQHAHQKGVVHRDIKPSNVLVIDRDGVPQPKVIDFGLARALQGEGVPLSPSATLANRIAGTPLYMAPEQTQPGNTDLDTRVDVYALGVLLHELLTGETPRQPLPGQPVEELLRRIREEPVTPPSRREVGHGVPAARSTTPARLRRRLRGDLDWIVLKALAANREDRYESAAALALDVQRHLRGEPVAAAPPSRLYRLVKFTRRNRVAVLAASLALTAVIAGLVGVTLALFEARRQQAGAERRRDQLGRINKVLADVFRDMNPTPEGRRDVELRRLLADRLVLAGRELEDPGLADLADVTETLNVLGMTLEKLGFPEKAIPLHERAWKIREEQLGPDHRETIVSINNLAEAFSAQGDFRTAHVHYSEALSRRLAGIGRDHPDTALSLNNLAENYKRLGERSKCLPLYKEALDTFRRHLGADDPLTLGVMNNLAHTWQAERRLDLAEPLYRQTLAARRRVLGPTHYGTLETLLNLAECLKAGGKPAEALPLYQESYNGRKATLGDDHPVTTRALGYLATAHRALGQAKKAIELHRQAHALMVVRPGPDHMDTLINLNNLAMALLNDRQLDEGSKLLGEVRQRWGKTLGPGHPYTVTVTANLARAYQMAGQPARGVPLLEENLRLVEAREGRDHRQTLVSLQDLARATWSAGDRARSVTLFEDHLARTARTFGKSSKEYLASQKELAEAAREARPANQSGKGK